MLYVLHAFQKKARRNITTPKQDVALIKQRLKPAETDYAERTHEQTKRND